jgi:hypothetical protein
VNGQHLQPQASVAAGPDLCVEEAEHVGHAARGDQLRACGGVSLYQRGHDARRHLAPRGRPCRVRVAVQVAAACKGVRANSEPFSAGREPAHAKSPDPIVRAGRRAHAPERKHCGAARLQLDEGRAAGLVHQHHRQRAKHSGLEAEDQRGTTRRGCRCLRTPTAPAGPQSGAQRHWLQRVGLPSSPPGTAAAGCATAGRRPCSQPRSPRRRARTAARASAAPPPPAGRQHRAPAASAAPPR